MAESSYANIAAQAPTEKNDRRTSTRRPTTQPVFKKNVARANLKHCLRLNDGSVPDAQPNRADVFAALQNEWPVSGYECNWVWLHLSKTYRIEFRHEHEYEAALTCEYSFKGHAFRLNPFTAIYKSLCIKNVDQIYQVTDAAVVDALQPYGKVSHIQTGGYRVDM